MECISGGVLVCLWDVGERIGALRLTGLPNVARYPIATVTRDVENISIHFGGLAEEQWMNVPLRYVDGDAEASELRLLAQLQEIGYKVRRG